MTAKEKAKEIVMKLQLSKNKDKSYYIIQIVEDAKELALITVDEIIKVVDDNCLEYDDDYWQEVKKEIELL